MKLHRTSPAAARFANTCALAALLSAAASTMHATTLTWATSATGTWDTNTTTAWTPGPVAWNDSNNDTALFGGATSYIVTVQGAGVTVGGLSFQNTNNVTLQTGVITLSEASVGAGVLIQNTGAGTSNPQINSVLTGTTNVTFAAGPNMTLNAANTYVGDTTTTGILRLNITNALPTATTLNISSGSVRFLGSSGSVKQEIAGLSGSGTVNFSTSGSTLTINTKNGVTTTHSGTSSGTGGLVIKGSGTQALTGATLSFTGSTTVSGGTLSLGSNLTGSSSVTVSGGTLTSSVANVNLGTGGVSLSSGVIDARGTGTVGSFTVASGQDFTSTGGSIKFDLDTTASLDQVKGSGAGSSFSLSGTTLTLNLLSWTTGDYNNSYTLFSGFVDGGSVSGVTITGYDTANWLASLSNAGVLSFSAAAIPEPSAYAALAGLGILGFAALRRRRAR